MIYRFGACELDVTRHVLHVGGAERPVEPQVFDLLHLLASRPGALVSRDALVEKVWRGRIVSEAAIDARITAARRAVGDDGRAQAIIRTVPRRGIRLVCPVSVEAAEDAVEADDGAEARPARGGAGQRVRVARSTDGRLVAFATTGTGPPLLRAGHWLTHLELDWTSPVWRPLLDALGESFSVTRFDQRGTGLSEREGEGGGDRAPMRFDLEAMADDLEAVANAAGLDRFPIFAASQGVPVAISFAARRPDRVTALLLYGGFALGRLARSGADRAEGEAFATLIETSWGRPGSAFVSAFATMFMPEATREQIDSFTRMQLASASPATAVRLRRAIDGFDVRPLLGRVRAPTLVVHARNDAVQPLDQARLLAAGIPGAELLVLESNNHAPLPQDPTWPGLLAAVREHCAG
jgi:pimeloyl-ACP methyl ester carboxylesterase/DNA-binding winged helix-turn-helix (wHTH) protein